VLASTGIHIRTTDNHSIFDLATGERTNFAKPVTVGDNVWLARNVMLAKGAGIPDNSVVAAMSFVSRQFTEKNTLIGGVPARVLKSGIAWARERRDRL